MLGGWFLGYIIGIAYFVVFVTALVIIVRFGQVQCQGKMPTKTFTFIALLFTAGLDMGLIMLPLSDFNLFANDRSYAFTNPLAIEFGMWGPLVWLMYFLSTFYFVVLEPRLRIFERPVIKVLYNMTIIATCAFSCFLFANALPGYLPGTGFASQSFIVLLVVACSVYSSGNLHFMKWLAVGSTWLFSLLLISCLLLIFITFGSAATVKYVHDLELLNGYFSNLYRFLEPISQYHEFYLYWWFAWSIMIGQFVSVFVGGMKAWRLAAAMVILPTIPIAIWFTTLYFFYESEFRIPGWLQIFMIFVGLVFVVNSLDSLIRLYCLNLSWTKTKLGPARYYIWNFGLQISLVVAYQFTPFSIEWVGLIVIGLYALIYISVILNRKAVNIVLS
ncbi:BCCT family transporter [Ochrobactrum sp. MYb379]|uniref:BCCT family transporter n=1 Tax=Ochrobactrum sp. MYb379 TaxID=2745275 RepID=UPI00309805E2